MGAAAHTSGGEVRLVLSGTAVAAALYAAVVLFGLGPVSPLALGEGKARPSLAVHVRVHDRAAPSPAARGPQPSPGPARHQPGRAHLTVSRPWVAPPAPKRQTYRRSRPASQPTAAKAPVPAQPQQPALAPAAVEQPLTPASAATPPTPPAVSESPQIVELPPLPTVAVPELPAPLPLP